MGEKEKELRMLPVASLGLSLRMPFVAKENETDVLEIVSNVSCQTRGEPVFSLDAAKKDKSQPLAFPGNKQTHKILALLKLPSNSMKTTTTSTYLCLCSALVGKSYCIFEELY